MVVPPSNTPGAEQHRWYPLATQEIQLYTTLDNLKSFSHGFLQIQDCYCGSYYGYTS
jgi:hypothetical protein